MSLDANQLRVSNFPDDTQCLVVQPMRAERVREFLRKEDGKAEKDVLALLEQNALFDLA